MTGRLLRCLIFCAAAFAAAQPLLRAQEPTPVIPPPEASPDTFAAKITEKPVAFAPLDRAQQLYFRGQFDEAIQEYNSIIRDGENVAAAYAGMARAYLKLKKPDDAYTAASKAVELDPELATAHSALGEVYLRQGKLYEAQTEFLTPFKLGHQDPRSYFGLERLYRASFNFKRAKVAIDQAHALAPRDPEISGDWLDTRPLPERVEAMEALVASPSGFYSRAEVASIRQHLAVMKDRMAHPERTCHLANRPDKIEMPLIPAGDSDDQTSLVALEVAVNGAKSRLVIGAEEPGIVINDKIAEKAKVEQIVRSDLEGYGKNNPPETYTGLARSIKVGALEFQNCYVTVVQHVAPGSYFDHLKGSISAALFDDYLVELDIPHAKLRLGPLPTRPSTENPGSAQMTSSDPDAAKFHDRYTAPEMSGWTQLYQFGGLLAIPARINESPPELFGISTKDVRNAISPDFAKKWATLGGAAPPLYGINGKIDIQWTGQVRLQFAGFYFDSMAESSFDLTTLNDEAGTEISGMLGFEVLRHVSMTIDYRDGLIHFDNGRESH